MNTRGCFLLFLVCFVSFAVSKHTLRVDTVLPAATNSVLIRNLTADVLDIGQADIQFIKLDLQDEDPFVINTNGSISFNGNVVGLDSNLFVNITAGQRGTVSTPDALELQGDLLALNGERFLFNAGGDIYLNTQGSIRAAASLITIGSQTEIDLHTGSGSIEALAKEQVIVSGQEIHYQGDDRISLYSYGNVNVDAAESFRAYANFIDFDSFGDIRLSSLTGNVELDTIYNLVFEGGNVNVNTNEGVDLASVHGEVYVAANDNLLVEAQSTLFVDVFDEMHYFATNQFSINAGTFAANVDSSVHVHGKTAEFVFAESEIYTHDLIAKTGGNIRFLLDSTAPNAPYNFTADEGISFTSRNILTNSTELILSSRQDLELLANERFSSVLSLTSTAQEIVAGNDVSFSGAVVVLNSATTNLQAGQDVVLLANNAIGGEVALNGGTSVSITAGDDVNVLSRNGRIVSSAVTFQANTNIFETGSAVDSEFLISSADTTITMNAASSFTQYSKYGGLNYLITQFNNNNNTYIVTAGSSQVSARDDVIILGNQLTITATGNSASPASPNAGVQLSTGVLHLSSNAATINTSDDARFTGKYVDVFVNGEGAFTAGQSVRVSTTTEDASVTYDAFRDILIEQLDRLVARDELRFESGNTLGLTALNGISFINDGITQVVGGSRNSITFNGKIASISATNAITANTGFLTIRAADDFNLNGGSLTLRTEDEENINILLDGSYTLTSNSNTEPFGQSYRSDDDLLIRANDFVSVSQTGNQLVQATQQFDVHAHEWSSNSTLGDLNLLAENDVLFALSGVSTVTVNGDYTLQFSRSIEQSTQSDFTLIAGGAFNIAAPIISLINDSPLASSGTNTISGADDFVQNGNTVSIQGGSLSVVAGGDFASTAAQSILHASVFVSMYNTTGDIVFNDDAVREARIRLESADFESNSGGDILLTGGNVFINSSNSEPIDLSSSGDVTVTSNNNTGISWYSERDFNTTALQGLRIEAFNPANATTGLSFLSTASKNSNATSFPEGNSLIELFTRQGKTTVNSLLSQTYRAENIQLRAGGDIHYNNFNRTNLVGGVSFRSNGTAHDGLYQDQAGITVRSSSTLGTINVAAPRGSIDVNAGENLELASTESAALFLAKLDIPLVASTGNLSLSAEQGAILLQANRKSVTFTTSESNTEISSSQSFFGLAGGQIVLTSSQVIDSTTNPNQLSFEFSALAGGIEEVTRGGNPINYQANDYLLRAAENATFTASDDVLLTARQGVLEAMANSGFEWVVSNGDLNLTTTSGSINVRSGADSNIDVLSGGDSRWTVQQGVNFTTGDNLLFRTERGDFVVRTNDTQSDILFTSDGATVFQADGVSNNVGQAFQDGIYVVGPLIQSESTGSATFDAKGRFVVGLTTRPIITLDAGGNGDYLGVEFTAVGNIQHTVGQDFTITTQGAFLQHTDQNLNMNAGGDFSLRSLGTSDAGKNVRIEGEGTVQVNAGTVSTNAQARTTVQSEDALTITSTGANPATSYINIDVTNQLRIDVNETLDINGNTWLVQADTFTLTTLGSVEFVNSNAAGVITLSADSVLGFSSDGTTSFTTSGPAAPLTLTSFGSNSNIDFETRGVLSDILIRANASLIIDAENEASLETTRSFTLTAPLNRLGQSNNSNIAFNSDQDLLFSAGYDLTASSLGATNITTTGAGSDIDFVSGGQALLQSWQNMTFASLNENILIQNGFNVELSSREGGNGSVSIASTRDLLLNFNTATPADRTPNVASYIEGDQTIVARGTYSVRVFDGALTLQAAEDNGDLLFTAQNGPIIITTTNQLELRGGDLGFTSQGKQTITSTGTLDVETNGLQNSINLFSEQGLLQFFATEFNFNAEYQPTGTTEADDFRSYIEFTAKGTNTVGKYSILFDNPDSSFTVTSENGGFDLLSSAANNVTATESFTLSAASVNGKVEFLAEADFGAMEFEATTSFELNTPEDGFINIRAGNDTSFFPTGPMTVTAADDITIESFHGDGSIRLFTTDRLIGDISVDAVNFNSYSWDNSTYLLIDDDDTAFVGTYLTTAPQIYMAADNDVVIEEIGLGDIEFNSAGNWLFTAGGNIIMEVRERFEVDVGALLVESESDIYYYSRSFNIIATEDINFNARSDISFVSWRQDLTTTSPNLSFLVDPSAQDSNNVGGNDITFTASSLMTLGAAGADIFLASSSNSNAGPTTVDFRNGMQIPFRTIGADGDPCATAGLFFFQSTSNRFCFCNSSSQLDCIVATPFTADYLF